MLLRLGIVLSLSFVVLSGLGESEICYTCDPETLFNLVVLHGILLLATASSGRLMYVLVGTLLVFYASRVPIIQWAPDFYTYTELPLTLSDMRDATSALLWISFGLMLGCFAGDRLGTVLERDGPSKIIPFEEKVKDLKSFYYLVTLLFIASKGTAIVLILTTGVGLPVPVDLFSAGLRQVSKAANFLGFLGIVPIAWFMLRESRGFERRLTILAIVIFVFGALVSFSKVGMITAVIPFLLVYFVTGRNIPPRLLFLGGSVVAVVAFFLGSVLGLLRIQIAFAFVGESISIGEVLSSFDVPSALMSFWARVGSSFDVLSAVIKNEAAFLPYLSMFDELLEAANGYGLQLFEADAPQYAQLLPAILHGSDYGFLLSVRGGENVTLPAHLYLNFGVIGAMAVSLAVMLLFSFMYRYSKSVYAKIILIQAVFLGIPNGSGLIGIILPVIHALAAIYVLILIHGLFVGRSASARIRHASMSG